jgi:hypothetical protein
MYAIVWRPAADESLASVRVPHLEPIRRAVRAGRDGRVRLPDGRVIRPSQVVSIAEIEAGRVVAAWGVRNHGLDGRHEWRRAWRAAAAATGGLRPGDPRRPAIEAALEALEAAWRDRDPLAWDAAAAALEAAAAERAAVVETGKEGKAP